MGFIKLPANSEKLLLELTQTDKFRVKLYFVLLYLAMI